MENVYILEINHHDAYYREGNQIILFRNKADAISTMYAYLKQDYYDKMGYNLKKEFDEAMDHNYPCFTWCGQFDASVWETELF